LLDAIQLGLSRDRARRENEKALADLRKRFASLSPREREIVIQVARGRLSKQIAYDIGIAEATVKVHRSRAMEKMKAGSLPELGQMAERLKLLPDKPQRARIGPLFPIAGTLPARSRAVGCPDASVPIPKFA